MDSLITTSTRRVVAVLAAGAFGVTAPLVVSSLSQAAVNGHHAGSRDADGDRMPNRWERRHGLDAHKANAHRDADHDGLQNLAEFCDGTDPEDADSDEDGVEDGDDDSPDGDAEQDDNCQGDEDCDQDADDDADDDSRSVARSDDDCDTPVTARVATYVVG
jgi:hypothetical protein